MSISYPTALIEIGCLAALVAIAWLLPRRARRVLSIGEALVRHLPTSLSVQLVVVSLFAVLLRAAFLPWLGPPVPLIPDEYSILLQARTFMEGRLANPTHPLWPHFQAMHVNQVPAYASMYFPGRGVPLALGLLLTGQAWIGVWISFVLFAMSTVWMLRGWIGPRLALAGGLLVVLRLGGGSYWINSFWGGAFTALGAMLVFGALPRLIRQPSWSCGLVLGLGALILMTTRPFEGAVFCAAAGLFFLPRLVKSGALNLRGFAMRAGLPLAACVAVGSVVLLQYNDRATGDPLTTPYELNRHQYAITPAFLVQAPIAPDPPSAELPAYFQHVYLMESDNYMAANRSLGELVSFELVKLYHVATFYIGFAMVIPFLIGLWGSRRELPVVGTVIVFCASHMLTSWHFPHYAAPLFAPLVLITMRGLVTLGRWSVRERPVGYVLSRGAFIAAASPLILMVVHLTTGWPGNVENSWNRTCCAIRTTSEHSEVIARLNRIPGDDLVLVLYNESFPKNGDIVFNEPDLERSAVLFAHSLSDASNIRLLAYFRDRQLWVLHFKPDGYSLVPMTRETAIPK